MPIYCILFAICASFITEETRCVTRCIVNETHPSNTGKCASIEQFFIEIQCISGIESDIRKACGNSIYNVCNDWECLLNLDPAGVLCEKDECIQELHKTALGRNKACGTYPIMHKYVGKCSFCSLGI